MWVKETEPCLYPLRARWFYLITAYECTAPVNYLQQLGITKIDYNIISHYHADHIGCTPEILQKFPLQKDAIDRGGSYSSQAYDRYVTAVGNHRRTATPGMNLWLDSASAAPVKIEIAALNGNGIQTM